VKLALVNEIVFISAVESIGDARIV